MEQTEVIASENKNNDLSVLETLNINYGKLQGRGGAFLVTPVDTGKVFSREQFSEDHKMFEQTAMEYGETRLMDVREDLNVLNKDLSLEIFKEMVNVTGLIVTKLDGSAKGGVLIGLADQYKLPVHAIGVGESIDDLRSFKAVDYARSLMGLDV